MTTSDIDTTTEFSRAKRLKAATHEAHDLVDRSIMGSGVFLNRERYGAFLTLQHRFHRDIDALYASPRLNRLLPDLTSRRRLGLIEQDLADLAIGPAIISDAPRFRGGDAEIDLPTALGWLYVAEGSNLGAAFLLKEVSRLGLSESFGARHLAAAPEGRGLHWKTFTTALDAVPLSDPEERRAIAGAQTAFGRVQGLVDEVIAA